MSFAVTSVVVGAVGIGLSYSASKKAGKASAAAGAEEARIEGEVTAERLVQIKREEMLTREATKAATVASGVKVGSKSTLEVLADQEAQFARERAITDKVGASRAGAALARGQALSQQYKAQGQANAISGLSNIFGMISQLGK